METKSGGDAPKKDQTLFPNPPHPTMERKSGDNAKDQTLIPGSTSDLIRKAIIDTKKRLLDDVKKQLSAEVERLERRREATKDFWRWVAVASTVAVAVALCLRDI